MRSSSLKVYSPVEYTGYKEKRSGHPSEPGSRTGNRKTTRKPKPILYRLRRFCKRLNWKRIGGRTMKQDDDALLAYLKASGNEDMIQNTEKPKWGEFKKQLEIVGGQIVDKTTGELVEGVQIIEKPDTFTVDV